MWVDLESINPKWSQKEKNKYSVLTHVCGIKRNSRDEPICKAGIETQMLTADMWTQVRGRGEWDELGDGNLHIYTATCKTDSLWKFAVWHQELSSVLCGDLEGWDGGGSWEGSPRGRGYTHTQRYIYIYSWFTLLYSRNWHDIVKQIHPNYNFFKAEWE